MCVHETEVVSVWMCLMDCERVCTNLCVHAPAERL